MLKIFCYSSTKQAILRRSTTLLSLPIQIVFPGATMNIVSSHCTVNLLFDWFGISCMTADNFCFYLQNRLIQTSQTGRQPYNDTSPLVFPASWHPLYCPSYAGLLTMPRLNLCSPSLYRIGPLRS